jgi:hypothetical protein
MHRFVGLDEEPEFLRTGQWRETLQGSLEIWIKKIDTDALESLIAPGTE